MIKIVEYFLNKQKILHLLLIFIMICGVITIIKTKKQAIQSMDYGGLFITTLYPGASPKDVEVKVTSKLEKQLKSIDGIKDMTSRSMESFSSIEITLHDNSNFEKVKLNIRKAIEQVDDLPDEIKGKPVISEINEDIRPMMEIAVTGEADYGEIRKYVSVLEKNLLASPHVGKVDKAGYLKREIKIEADQEKLKKNFVSISEILNAVRRRNFRMSAGDLIDDTLEKKYIVMSEFTSIEEVSEVIIRSGFLGNKVVISDIARIIDGYEKPRTSVRYNGEKAVHLILVKKADSDMLDVVNHVNKIVDEFKETLPGDIRVEVIVDYSREVQSLLSVVVLNALIGFALVLFTLFLMLNFKVAFWTAMGIPTSIFMAFILFPLFGITIHYISLVAIILVLGMLVDDAIIIAENIYRLRELGMDPGEAALKGVSEVIQPVIGTVLTTIVVFLPIIGMTGVMGQIFSSIPYVITLLLCASLLEGLIFLPSHMAHAKIKSTKKSIKKDIFGKIEELYKKIVTRSLRFFYITIPLFLLILAFSVFVFMKMDFLFFDTKDGLIGYVKFETPRGTRLEETARRVKKIEEILLTLPEEEVKGFITTVGEDTGSGMRFGSQPIKNGFTGNIVIHFTAKEDRSRNATQIMKEVSAKLKNLEGFTRLEADKFTDGPPIGRAVTVTFISNNDRFRVQTAEDFKQFLQTIEGVKTIDDNQGIGKKQIEVVFDYNLLSRHGLDPLSVAETVRAAFDGIVVTNTRWEGEEVDFRVILNKESRSSSGTLKTLEIQNMNSLTVQNKQGQLIPIGKFVTLQEKNDLLKINHYKGDRAITIYADVDSEIITPVEINKKIKKEFFPGIKKDAGMQIKMGGEEQDIAESMINFAIAVVLALLGIYFILVILFNSFSQPLLVMLAIPFSFAGVIYAFFLHGMALSMPSMIGLLGLMGIVVNDSLVMISFLNETLKEKGLSIKSLSEGAARRLRPIILTTVTTAAGLFPLAYGLGGENSFASPMVMAIAWGLVFATLVTLILLPSLYFSLALFKQKIKGIFGR